MRIEELFDGVNMQDYYLGKVTQVYRSNCIAQIDNLDVMSDRSRFGKSFLPNTINYFVLIDSVTGIFLGEVFENKASRKNIFELTTTFDEKPNDYHEICIDTIALMTPEGKKFELAGFSTLGISDKVYIPAVPRVLFGQGRTASSLCDIHQQSTCGRCSSPQHTL